ncbi:hypothetical protein Z948_2926 [Sulfitobacter donghicola DSW-25 = KCTC 12864 = JCM 14565]|nr:hypothetical protein Z948_2926 [Sulfitobacter donghicola DSW-25 = KCTC 12864 = JCM 14565]
MRERTKKFEPAKSCAQLVLSHSSPRTSQPQGTINSCKAVAAAKRS